MKTQTLILQQLLSLPGVSVSPNYYTVDAYFEREGLLPTSGFGDDYPGATLTIMGGSETYSYTIYAGEEEPWDNPITLGKLKELNLLNLITPDCTEALDPDEEIAIENLRSELLDHMRDLAKSEGERGELALAAKFAAAWMEKYKDAAHFIRYSPRGFSNEIIVYGIRKGELGEAEKWIKGQIHDEETNAMWDVLTPDETRQMLEDSIYHNNQPNSAYRQFVETCQIEGWWNDNKHRVDIVE